MQILYFVKGYYQIFQLLVDLRQERRINCEYLKCRIVKTVKITKISKKNKNHRKTVKFSCRKFSKFFHKVVHDKKNGQITDTYLTFNAVKKLYDGRIHNLTKGQLPIDSQLMPRSAKL